MRSPRQFLASAALAATLATGLAIATPASASTNVPATPMVVATITIGDACGALANYIAFLEGRPPSRLRDFLLARARQLFDRVCR